MVLFGCNCCLAVAVTNVTFYHHAILLLTFRLHTNHVHATYTIPEPWKMNIIKGQYRCILVHCEGTVSVGQVLRYWCRDLRVGSLRSSGLCMPYAEHTASQMHYSPLTSAHVSHTNPPPYPPISQHDTENVEVKSLHNKPKQYTQGFHPKHCIFAGTFFLLSQSLGIVSVQMPFILIGQCQSKHGFHQAGLNLK